MQNQRPQRSCTLQVIPLQIFTVHTAANTPLPVQTVSNRCTTPKTNPCNKQRQPGRSGSGGGTGKGAGRERGMGKTILGFNVVHPITTRRH